MKIYNTFLFLVISLFAVSGQSSYSRIKINLQNTPIAILNSLGIETDHGNYVKGRHFINDFSDLEMELLEAKGIDFEVLIKDVVKHYVDQNKAEFQTVESREILCESFGWNYQTPKHYKYGSMGGFLTYQELLDELDRMHSLYPDLITARQAISEYKTHEDRPIYWVKTGSNMHSDQLKPKILYTALHHAREPASLSQMVFYLWYLLENYDKDPLIRFIIDQTDLYFIPCVNPDGYIFNEVNNPSGGGLWRKNRAPINEIISGVDLNRNYGYEWGHDDQGSSDNPNSNVFRGEEAFSEPETKAVKWFCEQHGFDLVLNYHAFGNLLIYPWGYNSEATEDQETFEGFGKALTSENDYLTGTGIETVGYTVNGGSDDWMYGALGIYSFTPEMGSTDFGFWPPQSAIDDINKAALHQNLVSPLLFHSYAEVTTQVKDEGELQLFITKYSLGNEAISIQLEPLDAGLDFEQNNFLFELAHLEKDSAFITYSNHSGLQQAKYAVHLIYPTYQISDTITLDFAEDLVDALSEEASDISQWRAQKWATTTEDFVSSPSSITDSPNTLYESGSNTIVTKQGVSIENASKVYLTYHAKWDIEPDFDYAQVLISTDSINFRPLCTDYTVLGNIFQDEGFPVYEGVQEEWVREYVDITEFKGEKIWIQFKMVADELQFQDGLYIDDLSVLISEKDGSSATTHLDNLFEAFEVRPNPVQDHLIVGFKDDQLKISKVQIVDVHGRIVKVEAGLSGKYKLDLSNHIPGIYVLRIEFESGIFHSQVIVKN